MDPPHMDISSLENLHQLLFTLTRLNIFYQFLLILRKCRIFLLIQSYRFHVDRHLIHGNDVFLNSEIFKNLLHSTILKLEKNYRGFDFKQVLGQLQIHGQKNFKFFYNTVS